MDSFERRWRLIRLLCEGPMYRQELVERLRDEAEPEDEAGLSAPSVSCDIRELREKQIGFSPLRPGDKKTRQVYHLEPELLDLFVTPPEAEALRAASQLCSELRLPEAAILEQLLTRIPAGVKDRMREPYGDRLLTAAQEAYDADVLAKLRRGIREGRMIRITYQPVGKAAKRYLLDRAKLSWQDGHLYLLAHCPEAEGATPVHRNREFRLDRFCRLPPHPTVEVLDSKATLPDIPHFDLRLRVKPTMAPRFGNLPGKVRVLERAPDGSALVTLREAIPLRAVRRVLSLGGFVTVEGPDFVRSELAQTLERMHRELHAATAPRGGEEP